MKHHYDAEMQTAVERLAAALRDDPQYPGIIRKGQTLYYVRGREILRRGINTNPAICR